MKINEKWVKQWAVPSSSGGGDYIVSVDAEGNYACGCRGWTGHTPRTDCKHIREVRAGGGRELGDAVMDRLLGKKR